jgi:hypothetical protein
MLYYKIRNNNTNKKGFKAFLLKEANGKYFQTVLARNKQSYDHLLLGIQMTQALDFDNLFMYEGLKITKMG